MNVLADSRRARVGALTAQIRTRLKTGRTFISLPLLAFLTIVVLLGVNFVAVRFSNLELAPFWGAGLRFIIASFVLFMIVIFKRLPLPKGMGLAGAALFGMLVFGATYGIVYWALLHVSSGMAAVTFATIPLITVLLAVSLKLERLTWRSLFGAGLVLMGMGVVFQEQLRANVPLLPLVVLLLGALSGALSGIVIKRFPKSHPISTNAVAMAVGATLLIVTSRSLGEPWRLPVLPVTWAALGWLIMSASVAFILMVWLLSKWSASATSYSTVLQPLVTVVVASWLAGEQVTLMFALGGALALMGVYVGALTGQTERNIIKKQQPVRGRRRPALLSRLRRVAAAGFFLEEEIMWQTESAINIGAPVETVYEYLVDFPRHPEWSTGVEELVAVTKGPVTVGTELKATEKVPARFTSYTRITGLEPGRRIAWESWDGRTMKVKWVFELSPHNGSTHLVQRARVEPTSLVGRVLLAVMRKRQIPRENAQSLAQIKAKLEKQ